MKSLLPLLSVFFLATAAANASSKYTGQYFGISLHDGGIVAGVNLTVRSDGTFVGQGAYIDLTPTTVTGKVSNAGKVSITENSGGQTTKYTATFAASGKKFTARLSGGNVFRGKKITSSFPEAGIYYAQTDLGEEGIFILDKNGSVFGVIYDGDGDAIEVTGQADPDGFSGESADGVEFEGKFDGATISGTYSDGMGFDGDFSGQKY